MENGLAFENLMNPPILAACALIAPFLLLTVCTIWLRRLDPPEPFLHILSLTLLGFFSIILIGLWCWPLDRVVYYLGNAPLFLELFNALVLAAIPEELSRWLILRWRLGAASARLSSIRSLLLGGVVGLGLVLLENVAYALNGDVATVLSRAFTAAPFHMLAGSIVGYFVGYSLVTQRWKLTFLGLLITTLLHGINNFNPRVFYEIVLTHGKDAATSEFGTIFVSGWPQNVFTLIVAIGIVAYLSNTPFTSAETREPSS